MSNKYDELYNFRFATIQDVDKIMTFIHDEWGENHILAYDKKLFLWQYGRSEYGDEESINFILMTDKADCILGIIGFIAYDENNKCISPAMTMVSKKVTTPLSGLEFMKRQMQMINEEYHFASGTNKNTILPLYERIFHYYTGIMQQYFILNPEVEAYKIAVVPHKNIKSDYEIHAYELAEIMTFQELQDSFKIQEVYAELPLKSEEFLKKRYFDHPYYIYKKWIVYDGNKEQVGVLFGREIEINDAKILRFVDYRGELHHLQFLGKALLQLIQEKNYEYIDLVASNLSDWNLDKAGFHTLDFDAELIIPSYFEPFLQKNIKNYYQTKTKIVLFKADGDQDRPNHPIYETGGIL